MITWSDIDTVFLDLDGTLLDLNFDNHFWLEIAPMEYARKNQIPLDKAKNSIYKRMNDLRGTLDWYCIEFWSNELNLNIFELKHKASHLIKKRPGVDDFLLFLNKTNKKPTLITNAHPKSIEIKMIKTNISKYFGNIISSHDLGKPKEEYDFWTSLNNIHPFNKDRTLFIDDNKDVLRAARYYGIKHLMTILVPDLTKKSLDPEEFYGLDDFTDIYHPNTLV